MIPQRVTLITLGVADLGRARRFYADWGWTEAGESQPPEVVFYQLAGQALALYPRDLLARDQGRRDLPSGSGAITLACNLGSREAVDRGFATGVSAGATALAKPAPTAWGGYVAYLGDPDGHVWELAHNPAWPIGKDGTLTLPSAAGAGTR